MRKTTIIAACFGVGLTAVILIVVLDRIFFNAEIKYSTPGAAPMLSVAGQSFISALRNADVAAVKESLDLKPNLNLTDPEDGDTSLLMVIRIIDNEIPAAQDGSKSDREALQFWQNLAEKILAAGADVNGNGDWGHTPLDQADTAWTVEILLEHKAKVDIHPYSGTPLYWHAVDDYVDIEKLLLEAGANPNIKNYEGQTPLHKAAADEAPKVIALMIQFGADINQRDDFGDTPLKLAQMLLKYQAIEILQSKGGVE
jgi:ankyrin repeat protein